MSFLEQHAIFNKLLFLTYICLKGILVYPFLNITLIFFKRIKIAQNVESRLFKYVYLRYVTFKHKESIKNK